MIKNLPDLIEDFLRYLKVQRGRTALTVRNYQLYLKRFLNWCAAGRLAAATDLTRERLRHYRLWLAHQRSRDGSPLSRATQNYHLTALRSFVNYLQHKEVSTVPAGAITLHPRDERQIMVLAEPDLAALRRAVAQSREPDAVKLRDQVIIELITSTGLKISELVKLQKAQIDTTGCVLSLARTKQTERITLAPDLCRALQSYLAQRSDGSPPAFVRHDRAATSRTLGPLTPRSVQRSLERYRKLAGLKQKVTPHTLRHSFAARLARAGADLATVQTRLGLKHKTGAKVYNHTDENERIDRSRKIT